MTRLFTPVLPILILLPVLAMANEVPKPGSFQESVHLFPDCPETPNCVSSLAKDPGRRVEPFPLKGTPDHSLEALTAVIKSMKRAAIVSTSSGRIEAEFRSILGFVDDLILAVSPDGNKIHVRSAARAGSWDLGVNRRRVERIRKKYLASGAN
jgi:uncharacterized protein (DUF1499 family)